MATFAKQELRNSTFEQRWKWIEDKKLEGNSSYKEQKFEEAIDTYLACLCGFEFGKGITNEQKHDVEFKLKIPILNNLALCLIGQKKYDRAIQMLDQVLKIDQKQEKALIRKCTCYIELVEYDKAEQTIKKLQDVSYESENKKFLETEI